MGRFLLLTRERVNILPGRPEAFYRHFHMRTAKKLQRVGLDDMKIAGVPTFAQEERWSPWEFHVRTIRDSPSGTTYIK